MNDYKEGYLTIQEYMAKHNVCRKTVYNRIERKKLKTKKLLDRTLVKEKPLNAEEVNKKLSEIITDLSNKKITPKEANELMKPLNKLIRETTKELGEQQKSGIIKSIPFFESSKDE